MPGLVGFVTKNPDAHDGQARLSTMLRAMGCDPSQVRDSFAEPGQGLYVGWVSQPGSISTHTSDCGNITLVFCGEHFTHGAAPAAADTAQPGGDVLRNLDAGVEGFLRAFNGWFAGVLIDRRQRRVFLFNDRYGVHRIHYWQTSDLFVFASEAKSVLSVAPATRALDEHAVGQYLGFGTVFGNRTLFRNLNLLPGGSCWAIGTPGAIETRSYFNRAEWTTQPPLPPGEFHSSLRDIFRRVLPSYFVSKEPVGLSLTGGLDTRIVMAGMPADVTAAPCYTYGGTYRECYDIEVARQIAAACNLSHTVLPLGSDFFLNFREYAEQTVRLTDGTLDITGAHEIYFTRQARELSPVRLTGNYGSEILRSVSTFKYGPVGAAALTSDVIPSVRSAQAEHAEMRAGHPVTFAAFCEVPWHLAGRRLAAEASLVLRSPYMDNELVALLYRAPAGARESAAASVRVIQELNPRLAVLPTDMAHGGIPPAGRLTRLWRYLLFKAEWYYNLGMPDWVVRHERRLPLRLFEPLFLGKHKIEHYRLWFRGPLRRTLLDILSDPGAASRPYLNPRGLSVLIDEFAADKRNCVGDVSRLTTLELVQRQLIHGHAN